MKDFPQNFTYIDQPFHDIAFTYKRYVHNSTGVIYITKQYKTPYPSSMEVRNIYQEYQTLRSIDGDFILTPRGMSRDDNIPLLIYNNFSTRPLSNIIDNNGILLNDFLPLALKIAKIIQSLHEQTIIHKCLNPSTLFYDQDRNILNLGNFGIATNIEYEKPDMNFVHVSNEYMSYISPEQTGRTSRMIDYRTDYYSMGLTFYTMLTGFTPHKSDHLMGWFYNHITQTLPSIDTVNPQVPSMVSNIIDKLISKDAEDRYQSAIGIIHDLQICENEYTSNQTIKPFTIGEKDTVERFQISPKFFGRENEKNEILQKIEEISQGNVAFSAVTGYSGIGKTALVNEAFKSIVMKKGVFIKGKFDQFQRDRPYFAFVEAFQDLLSQLLSDTSKTLEEQKQCIQKKMDNKGAPLLSIVPEMIKIIGEQPQLASNSNEESRLQLIESVQLFINAVSSRGNPLIIFLDDLQWSDYATLFLLENLLCNPKGHSLYIIGAYRDNEVHDNHPLVMTFQEIKKVRYFDPITLRALDFNHVNSLIADTINHTESNVRELTKVVYNKTEGNPFFTIQFLKNLYQQKYLYLNHTYQWEWDIISIRQLDISTNVVEFMVKRLQQLPKETIQALNQAACIGNSFDIQTLSIINGLSSEEIRKVLLHAVKESMINPVSPTNNDKEEETLYKFQHDRIQQAAYVLEDNDQRLHLHKKIGNFILATTDKKELEERIISIVNQLNKSIEIITDESELIELAYLNFLAAGKSQKAMAYESAENYYKKSLYIIEEKKCTVDSQWYFTVKKCYFEILYQRKKYGEAAQESDIILPTAPTLEEKANILSKLCDIYKTLGQIDRSVQCGLEGLRALNIEVNEKISRTSHLKFEKSIKEKLENLTNEEIINHNTNGELTQNLAIQIISQIAFTSASRNINLCYHLLNLGVDLSLKNGLTPESAIVFINYTIYLGEVTLNWQEASRFTDIAWGINRKLHNSKIENNLTYYSLSIYFWTKRSYPYSEMIKSIMANAEKTGTYLQLGFAMTFLYSHIDEPTLERLIERGEKYISICKNVNFKLSERILTIMVLLNKNFFGETRDYLSLDDGTFNIKQNYAKLLEDEKHGDKLSMHYYHFCSLQMHYHYHNIKGIKKHLQETNMQYIGTPFAADFSLYTFLSIALILPTLRSNEKLKAWHRLNTEMKQMKIWIKGSAARFTHKLFLMKAEYARLKKDYAQAQKYYDKAAESARVNNYPFLAALINECTAHFHSSINNEKIAQMYFRDAIYLYNQWGAIRKSTFIEKNYITASYINSSVSTLPNHQFIDMTTLIKASHTLSETIIINELLHELIKLMNEHTGAQQSLLLLHNEKSDHYLIHAESKEDGSIQIYPDNQQTEHLHLAKSILADVIEHKKTIIIKNALEPTVYENDPVLIKKLLKSIMVIPLLHRHSVIGIVYLYNNATSGVFTQRDIEITNIIASQAAISIHNARLYEDMETIVYERTNELKKTQKLLLQTAHKAGMAEIATGVLHNFNNILNSINVNSHIALSKLGNAKFDTFTKVNNLVNSHKDNLGEFFTENPKGKKSIEMYNAINDNLLLLGKDLNSALTSIADKSNQMAMMVKEHEQYIQAESFSEDISLIDEIKEIITMMKVAHKKDIITLSTEKSEIHLSTPRYKLKKILEYILNNAFESFTSNNSHEQSISIEVLLFNGVLIKIKDNGLGIPRDRITKIFNHGFTTKENHEGAGLHNCANSIKEIGGNIKIFSDGLNCGTIVSLSLPESSIVQSPVIEP